MDPNQGVNTLDGIVKRIICFSTSMVLQIWMRGSMTKIHTSILLVMGIAALGISLVAFYAMSGVLATWLMMPNTTDSVMHISMTTLGFTFVFVMAIWPLIGYWIDVMFMSYSSADDE